MSDLDKAVDDGDTNGWTLTPEGREFAANSMGIARKAYGIDEMIAGIKAKFREREWLLIEEDGGVEIWSFEDAQTVTVLDEELITWSRDMQGNLLESSEAVCEWLALKLMAARDGQDHELTAEGLAMRKWLQVLPIDRSVKDGSCIDQFLSGDVDVHTDP